MFEQLSLFLQLKKNNKKTSDQILPTKPKNKNEILFLQQTVEIIRRPYQRSISVYVKPNGRIRVTCATLTSKKMILHFLTLHTNWIENTLKAQKKLQEKFPPKRYLQGEEFLFLGQSVYLNFSPTTAKTIQITVSGEQMDIFIPSKIWHENYHLIPHPELKTDVVHFYKKSAKNILTSRCKYLTQKTNLHPKRISFRSQKSRWGSCSSQGNISLNWRLIAAPIAVQDYVIIHELCHLTYQNHSADFWALVKNYCPNYKAQKKWLREHQFKLDFLAKTSELHTE